MSQAGIYINKCYLGICVCIQLTRPHILRPVTDKDSFIRSNLYFPFIDNQDDSDGDDAGAEEEEGDQEEGSVGEVSNSFFPAECSPHL